MHNRLFLLVLLSVLLLIQAALRSAAQATPFSGGETLGGVSFWELRGALPLGVFAAGLLLVTTAAMAQCLQATLSLAHTRSRLHFHAGLIASASLWCGAPLMAMCYASLPCIFTWIPACDPQGWQTPQHLEWVLNGCIITLVLCRVSTLNRRAFSSWLILPLGLLCLLALGQMSFNQALILLPAAVMCTAGLLMLLGRGRKWACIPLLTAAGMNASLFYSTAPAISTIPPCWLVYTLSMVLIATPFGLKIASLRQQQKKLQKRSHEPE